MSNYLNKTFQLFKPKLAYFFIIVFILLSANTFAGEAAYLKDYSSSRLVPIYQVQRDDQKITLTVDGAWGSNQTEALLELFKREEIPVSFFFAGIWLKNNPELVNKIIASGHQIYNHSYSHPHFNTLTKSEIKAELLRTESIINNYQDSQSEIKLFRPPYGEYNSLVIETARELGYQVVQWSLDSHDWMNPGKEYIIERVNKNISSGDILLFHNDSNNIVEILAEIIPMLKEEFQFVKIEDLIYNNNYQISSQTGLQYKIKDDANGN
ncbi:peptidoglycan/xylan/chitin deacetylase (PgdA/CDA1 family) [Halanaerobium saccharolyticum]|uniref:Peptidoglycan/xylan/chitin deacetylase (PgdA/CDA1 family) n=1 Tax=Halanaerobium saccharolyticum TaxID=43595 RepID=A0A4R7Z6J6_9FIRM|nr:polysaccharide deacetylase family protein [Halanaerobium saccharolyticum]RAK11140.1 peptidoglycan/xylan/chitin deacetylase (PgdA/CDA1 family) [Halanaerobium saccharolyticum]TDW06991.1 peptidoglycan/xylan/chitin deacetylase (PgdA/CDA1 family) [Halanaerobium saccharolyticum]TDX63756.1 peptidoglycan/xylan/chitin deacetylase (PgdA/CDA1 family) [Halanaerobium saccharolyticum]